MAKKKKQFELPERIVEELDEIMEINEDSDHPIHEKFVKEKKIRK